jgi:hypothetical protein
MKNFIACTILLLLTITVKAQPAAKTFNTKAPVKIINWAGRSVYFADDYWTMARPQLEKKLSKALADSIITYAAEDLYPVTVKAALSNAERKPGKNDLKIYHVATFNNNYRGKFHGVIYVLWVPRAENKTWAKDAAWQNDFFIVLPKEDVAAAD